VFFGLCGFCDKWLYELNPKQNRYKKGVETTCVFSFFSYVSSVFQQCFPVVFPSTFLPPLFVSSWPLFFVPAAIFCFVAATPNDYAKHTTTKHAAKKKEHETQQKTRRFPAP